MPRKPPPPGDVRYALGSLIQERRCAHGLTQRELAALMTVTAATVCQWEQGRRQPSIEELCRLAFLHDMPLSKYVSPLDTFDVGVREEYRTKRKASDGA